MVKKKSRTVILSADGTGGMSPVVDRRFETADWPIQREVASEDAEYWLAYLTAESGKRGWQCQSIGQMEHAENSGSIALRDGSAVEQLAVVWERKRGGPLRLFARPSNDETLTFLDDVSDRCRARMTEPFHVRGLLEYTGLPWHGELWLSNSLRLSAPSKQDDTALLGPRIVVVDAQVDGIEWSRASAAGGVLIRELSVFLTVVLRTRFSVAEQGERVWTWRPSADGAVESEVRYLGYSEPDHPAAMPTPGQQRPVPTKLVSRPDFSIGGITAMDTEIQVPDDMGALWEAFERLANNRRRDFLQAGSLYQLAFGFYKNFRTASFAFMVAACEALKPPGRDFEHNNAYDVIEVLLGKAIADDLRAHRVRPQDVRSVQFHRGEFRADEFIPRDFASSFHDPSFDEATRQIFRTAQAAIIEWLKCAGVLSLPPQHRRGTWRRWIRKNALILLPLAFLVGAAVAFGLTRW